MLPVLADSDRSAEEEVLRPDTIFGAEVPIELLSGASDPGDPWCGIFLSGRRVGRTAAILTSKPPLDDQRRSR